MSLLCQIKLDSLKKYVNQVKNKEGVVFELGVYKGGSALLIAQQLSGKEFHIFDTFSGMPEATVHDNVHKKGDFHDTSVELITKLLKEYNVDIHVGFVPDTFSEVAHIEKICFVHLDLDLYEGYRSSLAFVYPRMVTGGIILLDDYGADTCLGAKKATDEFFADKPEKPVYVVNTQWIIEKL